MMLLAAIASAVYRRQSKEAGSSPPPGGAAGCLVGGRGATTFFYACTWLDDGRPREVACWIVVAAWSDSPVFQVSNGTDKCDMDVGMNNQHHHHGRWTGIIVTRLRILMIMINMDISGVAASRLC
jgi:hypothetical protein